MKFFGMQYVQSLILCRLADFGWYSLLALYCQANGGFYQPYLDMWKREFVQVCRRSTPSPLSNLLRMLMHVQPDSASPIPQSYGDWCIEALDRMEKAKLVCRKRATNPIPTLIEVCRARERFIDRWHLSVRSTATI
jgi:hypothetical protein